MTPQYRDSFAPEWTIEAVKAVLGKQVKVIGELMADNEHNVTKDNCGLAGHGASCWRASIWELHPVTSLTLAYLGTRSPGEPTSVLERSMLAAPPAQAPRPPCSYYR